MPHVSDLRIFPIKGFDPHVIDTATFLPSGALTFDRRWALVDARRRFINGKNRQAIHTVRTVYDLQSREVLLDGHTWSLDHQGGDIASWFSDFLGEPLSWQENDQVGFPDDLESPGPTFITEASLVRVADWFQLEQESARRRFRTNIEIAGVEPFWEDRLYGGQLRAGQVLIDVINPCQRCAVPTRDPFTGEGILAFQKCFAEFRRAELPSSAVTAPFNHYYRLAVNTRVAASQAGREIHVGDLVEGIAPAIS